MSTDANKTPVAQQAPILHLLQKSPLFCGLSDADFAFALDLMQAEVREYARGEFLRRMGEESTAFGFVLSGAVGIYTDDLDGNRVLMACVTQGETFGESLSYLAVPSSPVYIVAVEDARVLLLRTAPLRHPTLDPRIFAMRDRFAAMLASRTLAMNDRIQVLSKRTLREKLLTFFAQNCRKNHAPTFSVPFDREGLALYLGCDRAALSRELSRMQKEGILEFYRNSFRILHPSRCICNVEEEENGV